MFCRNCGNQLIENAAICVKCGVAVGNGDQFCPTCGNKVMPGADVCLKCGVSLKKPEPVGNGAAGGDAGVSKKSKLVAGLLGIFCGGIGIHNFYLGKAGMGIAQIFVSIITCGFGAIWGFIEGILILCGKGTDSTGARVEK